jgi:hypothetical protein
MIPHPALRNENEIFANGNGLKDRVTACRKRLRLNRIHRAHVDNQLEELFRETAIGAPEFHRYPADHCTVREASVKTGVRVGDGETSQRIDEQEVGIT